MRVDTLFLSIVATLKKPQKNPNNQTRVERNVQLNSVFESIFNITNVHDLQNLLRDMYRKRILLPVLNSEFICSELCLC